jgi:DNA-binding transcriptional ArsR family regulator
VSERASSPSDTAAVPDPLDRTLAALADPHRRRVVELLRERPRRAGELAVALAVRPSVMSRHLKVLRDSKVVEEASPEFDARVRIYSLRSGATAELRSWLDAVERGWADQLAALKAHVEQSP